MAARQRVRSLRRTRCHPKAARLAKGGRKIPRLGRRLIHHNSEKTAGLTRSRRNRQTHEKRQFRPSTSPNRYAFLRRRRYRMEHQQVSKVRLGLVGCGNMAQQHASRFNMLEDRVVLTAAVDYNIQSAEAVCAEFEGCRAFTDYRDILDCVDAVLIAVPHHYHHEIRQVLPGSRQARAPGKNRWRTPTRSASIWSKSPRRPRAS